MAIKEMKNYAVVEGLLSEIGLEVKQVPDAKGVPQNTIMGELTIRVTQEVERDGGDVTLEVPVRFYSKEKTNAGNENPAYTSALNILENGQSIAVAGEEGADAVRITGARIAMQEYYASGTTRLISFPSISGSFINIINRTDMVEKAQFEVEGVIDKIGMVLDNEGVPVEPATMRLNSIHVGYGEYTHIIPFLSRRADINQGIQAAYAAGDAITLSGKINFSSTTETYLEPVEIGDPIEKQRTVRISELLIAGVAPRDISSEIYDPEGIKACLAKRTARLEENKAKAMQKSGQGGAPRTANAEKAKPDLGF